MTTKTPALAVADRLDALADISGAKRAASALIRQQAAELETLRAPVADSPIPDREWPEGVQLHLTAAHGAAWSTVRYYGVKYGREYTDAPDYGLPPGTITIRPDPRLRAMAGEVRRLRDSCQEWELAYNFVTGMLPPTTFARDSAFPMQMAEMDRHAVDMLRGTITERDAEIARLTAELAEARAVLARGAS